MSATVEAAAVDWPLLPTETEIYILPDGRVIIADLPAELAACLLELGALQPDAQSLTTEVVADEADDRCA